MTEILCQNIQKLYRVQPDESNRAEMESLSSAFGVMLHSTGVKSQLPSSPVLSRLREKVSASHSYNLTILASLEV